MGTAEQIALALVDAELLNERKLKRRLDAFGRDRSTRACPELDERGRERARPRVALERARKAEVELHDVRRNPKDVTQAREAGADIVDRNARAECAQTVECSRQRLVVGHLVVLGELDDESIGEGGDEL